MVRRRSPFQPTTAQLVSWNRAGRDLAAMGVVGAERRGSRRELFAIFADGQVVHSDQLQARLFRPLHALAAAA